MQFKKEVKDKLSTLVISAFGFVAALAWNETVKQFFIEIFGETSTLMARVIYAVFVTVLAVIITLLLTRKKK